MTLGSASDTKTKAAMHSSGPQGATDSTRSPIVAVTTGESSVLLSKVEPSQPNRTPSPPNLGSMLPSADVRQPAPSGPTERFAPKAQNTVSFAQPIAGRDASVSKAIHAPQSNPGITPQSTLAPPMQVFDLQPRSKTVNTGKDETNSKAPRGENLQSHHPALQQAIHPTVVAPAVAPVPAGVASPDEAGRQLIDGALDKLPARESLTGSIAPASDSGPARLGAATLPSSTQAATPPTQQVAIALRQAPVGTTTEIRLEPEELGRVAMTLRGDEKGMSVHIMADRPETLELLRRQSDSLISDLADLGYQDVDLQFGTAAEGEDATDHDRGSDDRVTDTGAWRDDLDNSQRAAIAPGSGSLDIRL